MGVMQTFAADSGKQLMPFGNPDWMFKQWNVAVPLIQVPLFPSDPRNESIRDVVFLAIGADGDKRVFGHGETIREAFAQGFANMGLTGESLDLEVIGVSRTFRRN